MARAIATVHDSARRGESFEVRVQIAHPMETGYRSDAGGAPVPRDILRRFACRYAGETVLEIALHPAIAANPYFAFHVVAVDSGPLEFAWTGDNGFAQVERRTIAVT